MIAQIPLAPAAHARRVQLLRQIDQTVQRIHIIKHKASSEILEIFENRLSRLNDEIDALETAAI